MTTHKQDKPLMTAANPVDDLIYLDSALATTHPDTLYVLGTIYGMSPAPVTRCNVLSLSTNNGTNLIAMAYGLPGSKFIGVTQLQHDLEDAQAKVKALNLKNIEFKLADVMELNKDLGEFDYIIAKGIYSWVNEERRNKILTLFRDLLTSQGIAYLNFNSNPGWGIYKTLREMMKYHLHGVNNSHDMVKKAREFLQILSKSASSTNHYNGAILRHQLETINNWRDDYLRHDTLADINQPFYLHEIVEAAEKVNLQYLADAEFHTMVPGNLPDEAFNILNEKGINKTEKDQYMDFFNNRMFKQSLFVHADVKLSNHLNPDALRQFYYAAPIAPVSSIPDIQADNIKSFESYSGIPISASDPIMKACLLYLSLQYPLPQDFNTIIKNLKDILGADYQYVAKDGKLLPFDQAVIKNLLDGFGLGMLKVFAHPINVANQLSDKPLANALVRYEAVHGLILSNQLHEPVSIDIFSHHVMPNFNGKNTIADIVAILSKLIDTGKISLRKGDDNINKPEVINEVLTKHVDMLAKEFLKHALFVNED
jgi:methyltransferase-like protein